MTFILVFRSICRQRWLRRHKSILLAEILNFQGAKPTLGVGSFSYIYQFYSSFLLNNCTLILYIPYFNKVAFHIEMPHPSIIIFLLTHFCLGTMIGLQNTQNDGSIAETVPSSNTIISIITHLLIFYKKMLIQNRIVYHELCGKLV